MAAPLLLLVKGSPHAGFLQIMICMVSVVYEGSSL